MLIKMKLTKDFRKRKKRFQKKNKRCNFAFCDEKAAVDVKDKIVNGKKKKKSLKLNSMKMFMD